LSEKAYEITTADLVLENEEEIERPRVRTVPNASALTRRIRERSRPRAEDKTEFVSQSSKAESFYDLALEAERSENRAAALRHVKLAIAFAPNEMKYHLLLRKLS
jgi:hypothetical protein